jgi:hypothetical protein
MEKTKMEKRVKYIRIATITSLVAYSTFNVGFLIHSCVDSFDTYLKFEYQAQMVMTLQTALVFFLLAIAFFYTSVRMIKALETNFHEFY